MNRKYKAVMIIISLILILNLTGCIGYNVLGFSMGDKSKKDATVAIDPSGELNEDQAANDVIKPKFREYRL